jgi:predicted neutral ceramidase superfamily lipid hydrolase
VEGYRASVSKASMAQKSDVRVGYGSILLDKRNDVGSVGISAIVFEFRDKRQALLIVDGNNMVDGLAQRIREEAKGLGISDTIVTTNDNHSLTGVFRVLGGYYPVGSFEDDVIVEKSTEAIRIAANSTKDCTVRTRVAELGRTLVLGNSSDKMALATLQSLDRFKKVLISYSMYTLLLSVIGTLFRLG